MTEAEWWEGNNPHKMLHALAGLNPAGNRLSRMRNPILDRKFRLFAVACGRVIEDRIPRDVGRATINIAEWFADGQATRADLKAAKRAAWAAWGDLQGQPTSTALWTAAWVADWKVVNAASQAVSGVEAFMGRSDRLNTLLCTLVRDVFGNPLSPPPALPPAVLAWNDGTVPKLAQAIYDERTFDRMSILADALEEAGCTDADVLAHCRGAGPHVRGCWVVDLVLGKQ
jgi:hypothetical protein